MKFSLMINYLPLFQKPTNILTPAFLLFRFFHLDCLCYCEFFFFASVHKAPILCTTSRYRGGTAFTTKGNRILHQTFLAQWKGWMDQAIYLLMWHPISMLRAEPEFLYREADVRIYVTKTLKLIN
jgi:hypothetical protein